MAQKLGVVAALAAGAANLAWIDVRVLPRMLAPERDRDAVLVAAAPRASSPAVVATPAPEATGRDPVTSIEPEPAGRAPTPAVATAAPVPAPATPEAAVGASPAPAVPRPTSSQPDASPASSGELVATVYFDSMSKRIGVRARAQLDRVAKAASASGRLTLEGYADYRGDEAYNLELSQERAEAVARYLARQGIPAKRIARTPLGERSDGVEPTELWRDRRVDIRMHRGDDR